MREVMAMHKRLVAQLKLERDQMNKPRPRSGSASRVLPRGVPGRGNG